MLIEQVGGAWICEICNSGIDGDDLWKAAVIGGVYSGGEW
jgi:hypothetical protein